MKASTGAVVAAAAWAVAGVAAQTPAGYSEPVSYTTVTVDTCETTGLETLITVTKDMTVTYCPECEAGGLPPMSTPTPYTGPGYTTVYTTTYMSLCPTGVVPATYTVTESCTDATPTWTPGPSHIPDGFTTTEKECTVCGKETPTVTITEPCGCEATGGMPVPPKATPVQQIPDGQVQNPAPGNGSPASPAATAPACNGEDCGGSGNQSPSTPTAGSAGSGGSPAPSKSAGGASTPSVSCDGDDCGGSGNQSPGTSSWSAASAASSAAAPVYPTTSVQCPGPECRAKATGGAEASGPDYGNESNITPYEGRASSSQVGFFASIALSIIIGGLAFAL